MQALPTELPYALLEAQGAALVPQLLSPASCKQVIAYYEQPQYFRKTVDMARYRFGAGQYKYFTAPLPEPVHSLRAWAYMALQPLALAWAQRLGLGIDYPADYEAFLTSCAAAGALLPTPLLLRYGPGDYNTLHQDLYGSVYFPFQLVVCLGQPGVDFTGGEFVLTEQRPRAQSAARVYSPNLGDGLIFATRYRPVTGAAGRNARLTLRHGLAPVQSGQRFALGIPLHQAIT